MGDNNKDDTTDVFAGVEDGGEEEGEMRGSLPTLEPIQEDWDPELNRPRGILTPTDREYLWGQKEYKHVQSEANRRQEIRERIGDSIRDFQHLWFLLGRDDRTQVFEELGGAALHESLAGLIAFVYLGLNQDEDQLENVIEKGVYLGANLDDSGQWTGRVADVDTTIDIQDKPDVDEIQNRLQRGETSQLTPAEIGVLVREGKLDESDLDVLEKSEQPFSIHEIASESEDDEDGE